MPSKPVYCPCASPHTGAKFVFVESTSQKCVYRDSTTTGKSPVPSGSTLKYNQGSGNKFACHIPKK